MSPDPSKPVPLEAEAVEAAAKAAFAVHRGPKMGAEFPWERVPPEPKHHKLAEAQAAILAADEARGLRVQESEIGDESGEKIVKEYRLVSRWFPIKGPVE